MTVLFLIDKDKKMKRYKDEKVEQMKEHKALIGMSRMAGMWQTTK